jgi:hypothetical protein
MGFRFIDVAKTTRLVESLNPPRAEYNFRP